MTKVVQYGDERLIINTRTGQIVGHALTPEKKKVPTIVVAFQNFVRTFTRK